MNSRPRLLFYVQHLLGIGHLVRGSRIAKALSRGSFDVAVVVGGELPERLDFGRANVIRLPPVKAGPGGFADLVTPDGRIVTDAERTARRDLLLGHFERFAPDVLLIEAFPFGRRQMRFELLPLLEAAVARPRPPVIAASIRDILQENRKPSRDAETVDHVRRFFDLVLVHGDPALARLEDSFPLASAIADKLAYTGLVGPEVRTSASPESFDVIVSVGGGAVGGMLLNHALAARALCRLAEARWLVLTGPNLPADARPPAREGVTLRTFEADLATRFRSARLSVSQAGYNTVADVLSAPDCRAVLVPHAARGETEQTRRALLLTARGLAVTLEEAALQPRSLADAIDRALDLRGRTTTFDFDGAAHTNDLLERTLRVAGHNLDTRSGSH